MPDTVSIRPGSMSDNVADWPLDRVIDLLKQRERDGTVVFDIDCRVACRSGMKLFVPTIDVFSARMGCSRGRMFRWLSYHAVLLAKEDPCISKLTRMYVSIRNKAVELGDPDVIDLLDSHVPYSPVSIDTKWLSIYVLDQEIRSEINSIAQFCGVYSHQLLQVFMIRSISTSTNTKCISGSLEKFSQENARWDKWMDVRLASLASLLSKQTDLTDNQS